MERIGRRTVIAMFALVLIALAGTLASYAINGPGCTEPSGPRVGKMFVVYGCP